MSPRESAALRVALIQASGVTIYESNEPGSPTFLPAVELEAWLNEGLRGFSVVGLPPKTRSKRVKERVCAVLGYPVPKSFKRVKMSARFPAQDLDVYVQSADNLQVWNATLSPTRRYVLIREAQGRLSHVRVVAGADLAKLDTTGKLTQKYQARFSCSNEPGELISTRDTESLQPALAKKFLRKFSISPVAEPVFGGLLPVAELWRRMETLVGNKFADAGANQDRNRGALLHRLVCEALGFPVYADDGRFPDVRSQLLEVKLQTAATIDLGLVTPDSEALLDLGGVGAPQVRHCDVRYALFSAETDGATVRLTGLYLTTGRDFFRRFPRCEGKILNRKLQLRLPKGFL